MIRKRFSIRPLERQDIPLVAGIEKQCFADPWSPGDFLYDMTTNACARYYVLEENGVITGYAGMWMVINEAHVVNIAVLPHRRKRGQGRALMLHLFRTAYEQADITAFTLEVRKGNLPAIRLYEDLGFRVTEVKEKYYDDGEDAYGMVLENSLRFLSEWK